MIVVRMNLKRLMNIVQERGGNKMELLLLLIFPILSAVVGHSKNRSAICWFFWGIVIGPFGFILAAILPALPKH